MYGARSSRNSSRSRFTAWHVRQSTRRISRSAQRSLETGQKVVVGGAILAEARENPEVRALLVRILTARVTREADTTRITPLLKELKALS